MTIPALVFDKVAYAYRSHWTGRKTAGLSDISLTINEGESFGFLGHNGAGKTTAIKCLLDLVRPRSGRIRIFGQDSRLTSSRESVGYIPEQPYFYDSLTVSESLDLYATLSGLRGQEKSKQIQVTLERVGLTDRRTMKLRTLSKGLTQRLALAQAIIHRPRLLVLDEPFSGLDPIGRREFRTIFSELKHAGTTLFMSSHILNDVEFLCDRVSILIRGKLKGVFSTAEIPRLTGAAYELTCMNYGTIKQRLIADSVSATEIENRLLCLTFADRTKAESALKLVLDTGAVVESYQYSQGNLEDLFMKLVQEGEVPTT